MKLVPPYTTIVGGAKGQRQLADIQSRGFRVGFHHEESTGLWTATALFDDMPMYLGTGETKERAIEDLHAQVFAPPRPFR